MDEQLLRRVSFQQLVHWNLEIRTAGARRDGDLTIETLQSASIKIHQIDANFCSRLFCKVRDDVKLEHALLDMRTYEQVRIETARVILQGFPSAVIINAGPRRHRPAIVDL